MIGEEAHNFERRLIVVRMAQWNELVQYYPMNLKCKRKERRKWNSKRSILKIFRTTWRWVTQSGNDAWNLYLVMSKRQRDGKKGFYLPPLHLEKCENQKN